MVKYSIITLLIVSNLFSYAIKRTANVNIHRSVAIGITGVSDTEVTYFGLGIITPLSRYIGINAGLFGIGLGGYDVYRPISYSTHQDVSLRDSITEINQIN
jgi:hypothetical protein